MKEKISKLRITRETIRNLTEDEMEAARGGYLDVAAFPSSNNYCGPSTHCSGSVGCPNCVRTVPCPRSYTTCPATA